MPSALLWRHNGHDGVSNHQLHGCLVNRLFRRRSKKTSKLRLTGLCVGNSPGPVNSPHKGPVTRKMLPFDDVIMDIQQTIISLEILSHQSLNLVNIHFSKTSFEYPRRQWVQVILTLEVPRDFGRAYRPFWNNAISSANIHLKLPSIL